VLKWQVSVDDRPHKIGGGDIVHVAIQYPQQPDVVTVWTIEPRSDTTPKREVQVYGTGHPLPFFAKHLGSCTTLDGGLVWHLFELPTVEDRIPGVQDVDLPEPISTETKVAP